MHGHESFEAVAAAAHLATVEVRVLRRGEPLYLQKRGVTALRPHGPSEAHEDGAGVEPGAHHLWPAIGQDRDVFAENQVPRRCARCEQNFHRARHPIYIRAFENLKFQN